MSFCIAELLTIVCNKFPFCKYNLSGNLKVPLFTPVQCFWLISWLYQCKLPTSVNFSLFYKLIHVVIKLFIGVLCITSFLCITCILKLEITVEQFSHLSIVLISVTKSCLLLVFKTRLRSFEYRIQFSTLLLTIKFFRSMTKRLTGVGSERKTCCKVFAGQLKAKVLPKWRKAARLHFLTL